MANEKSEPVKNDGKINKYGEYSVGMLTFCPKDCACRPGLKHTSIRYSGAITGAGFYTVPPGQTGGGPEDTVYACIGSTYKYFKTEKEAIDWFATHFANNSDAVSKLALFDKLKADAEADARTAVRNKTT